MESAHPQPPVIKRRRANAIKAALCTSILAVVLAGFHLGQHRELTAEKLTIPESLGCVFLNPGGDEGGDYPALFRAVDPAIKKQLYMLLDDPGTRHYHPNILSILGYIGDADDATKIEKYIGQLSGNLPQNRSLPTISAALFALANLSKSGVKPATTILESMTSPSYWANAAFTLSWDPAAPAEEELDAKINWVLLAYSRSSATATDIETRCNNYLQTIPDSPRRSTMLRLIDPTSLSRKPTDPAPKPIPTELRARLPNLFNGNVVAPAPLNWRS